MPKMMIPPIEGNRVRLRLLEERDLPMTLAWRNQDHIRKWFVHSGLISIEQHRAWYDQYSQRDDDYLFIIEEFLDFKKPVGQVSIYKIDWQEKCGEFGRLLIGETCARGNGLAKEATFLILDFAFSILMLNRVELEVFSNNKPAIAIYRQCGFYEQNTSKGLTKMVRMNNAIMGL